MTAENKLTIIHLVDIHGAGSLIHEIGEELQIVDMVIVAGDITHFGRKKDTQKIIEAIAFYNKTIFAVAGNCDFPEVENFLSLQNINLHRTFVRKGNFTLSGLGGSLPCPGTTPFEYTEEEAWQWLSDIIPETTATANIFVSHQPPYNTLNDQLPGGQHVGSKSIREFIEKTSPVLCLTGHIHEGAGIDRIGNCKIVNPGPFRYGNYAFIEITGENSTHIELKQVTVF
ncbi:3',5'-cyclic adenosine monophosphate phosphodiesterase CpdA [subsurface metagenome]